MKLSGNEARKQQATETHSAHEGAEQDSEGDCGRADYKLKKLKPNNFIDKCGAAAPDKHHEEQRKYSPRSQPRRFVCGDFIQTQFMHKRTNSLEWIENAIMPCPDAWKNPARPYARTSSKQPGKWRDSRPDSHPFC